MTRAAPVAGSPDGNERAVYEACHRSADVVACGNATEAKRLAFAMTDPLRSNKREALRHFMWQSALTVVVNPNGAAAMGEAHEGADVGPDSQRDRINNAIALAWAADHRRTLTAAAAEGLPTLMAFLYREGERLWGQGFFAKIRRAANGELVLAEPKRSYP
ncbi:MAG: hypothetical protein ACT4QG_00780 [Sporichthyaceae bacterium]